MAYLDNDGLLYFWQQIKTKFADATHTHEIADTMGLQAALDYKANFITRSAMDDALAQQGIATPLDYANAKTLMANAGMFYNDDSMCANILAMAEVISALCSQIDANATTAAGSADGSITTKKLADNAVTAKKLADGSVTTAKLEGCCVTNDKIDPYTITMDRLSPSLVGNLSDIEFVATDATTQAVMANSGQTAVVIAPNAFGSSDEGNNSRTRLCWFTMANGLEIAPIGYTADIQGVVTFYARGLRTMASGTMNDTAWTITALPTDADGVSY